MDPQFLISGKYRIAKLIGRGTFGDVYQGVDEVTMNQVAIKTEELAHKHPQIIAEAGILRELQNIEGVPKFYWSGATSTHNLLVMQLLGPTLEDILTLCNRRMSLSSVLQLAEQLLRRIESIHMHGYVHRDIKPENCLMGMSKHDSLLYVIDFGLAKKFKDEETHLHIPFREGKGLMGTARYASIHSHLGMELSRRDDLESICYLLIYLCKGKLPWQGIPKQRKDEKHLQILGVKQCTSIDALCKDVPLEFAQLLTYVRGLAFEEKPDYVYLRRLVESIKMKRSITFDGHFEWKPKLKARIRSYSTSQLTKPRRNKTRLRTKFEVVTRSKSVKMSAAEQDTTTEGSDTRVKVGALPAFSQKTREMIRKYRREKKEERRCQVW